MKTLNNHTLIYDNECPMCNLYSKGFTQYGMLAEKGREAFTEISVGNKNLIDFDRAKNEIALIGHDHNKVVYGLDSLLLIIGNSFPTLAKIARVPPLYWFFKRLYSFVSYNRKQIIPSPKEYTEESCIPDFNLKYRIAYIAFVFFFSAYILSIFSVKLGLGLEQNFGRELSVCLGQILWQTLFLKTYLKEKLWDYLGNMMTVSLLGTFLLIPALLTGFSPVFYSMYFGIVVFVMFLEHIRRGKILKLNYLPTISWMMFRLTALVVMIIMVISNIKLS
ncbi:DCC1-like thiol-disulfide oxidoreductase family protein [Chryseobacterium indologenes]|uniref:DCC1-like thiol-disulfide oxidoreductase family protein n=1 Tax=Chryseobacterium indologenes TaxID=253 RepID=UPI0016296131|nr:DCC1-like thiol-disulfide oxidoreductase family protein [Chryseobacterium indologenes]